MVPVRESEMLSVRESVSQPTSNGIITSHKLWHVCGICAIVWNM